MRPRRPLIDRKTGGAVSGYGSTARILKHGFGPREIITKLIGRQREHARMIPAMACKFMPLLGNPADQRGVALGDPAKREKGRLDVGFGKHGKTGVGVRFDPPIKRVPVAAINDGFEGTNLEPVFNIDRERVSQHTRPLTGSGGRCAANFSLCMKPFFGLNPVSKQADDLAQRLSLFGKLRFKNGNPGSQIKRCIIALKA